MRIAGKAASRRYVGPSPIGLGYTKPDHYLEIAKALGPVDWPEANVLIRIGHYDPSCGEPDYNAVCEVIPR